jgi:hypothetical protein
VAVGVLTAEEVAKNWNITCEQDSSVDAEPLTCFGIQAYCPSGTICSWNGDEVGYCCKEPWEGDETCFSDNGCGEGGICGLGKDNKYYCTTPDAEPCLEKDDG